MITNFGAKKLLSFFTGVQVYSGSPLYMGFSKTEPTKAGTNVTEPTNTSYKRALLNNKSYGSSNGSTVFGAVQDAEDGGSTSNAVQITFPETWDNTENAVQDWGVLPYVCLFDAATGGNLLAFEQLTEPIHPGENNISTIAIVRVGDMNISISNAANTANA